MRPITERLSPLVRAMVIINAAVFAFYVLVKQAQMFFNEHLALGPAFFAGELWQPLTSLFVHTDFLSFAFNVLGLWFVGATVERDLGTRRFLVLFFVSGVVANVVMAAVSIGLGVPQLFSGCGTAVLGLFVAFGRIFNRTPSRVLGGLVLEARTLTTILVAFALLADITRGAWPSLAGDLVVVFLGYVLSGGRGAGLRDFMASWRTKRFKRRYQVLDGGRKSGKRPSILN